MSLDYKLPRDRIAQYPPEVRGASKLLIVGRKSGVIAEGSFNESLSKCLRRGDTLIFNNSKVVKARLILKSYKRNKSFDVLVVDPFSEGAWRGLVRGLDKLKEGEVFLVGESTVTFLGRDNEFGIFESSLPISQILDNYGHTPIPPYIRKGVDGKIDSDRYQTVYASKEGSIAAPTAGLHFSETSFQILKDLEVQCLFLTLHIGPSSLASYLKVVPEWFEIDEDVIRAIALSKKESRRVLAVGTSTIRALETYGSQGKTKGETDLIINEGYQFKIVDGFFTNFHLPKSTHLDIVIAFLGKELTKISYEYALNHGFKFYSYGDCMFCADD